MVKDENKIKLMAMVNKLDELKDKLNETIEFFLDKKDYREHDNFHIDSIESKIADLELIIELVNYEFSQELTKK